ncbi:MAG: phage head closure protein [Pseudorhodoferax sp.]
METGSLNRRIQIEKRGPAKDGWGQPAPEAWLPHVKLWANIRHQSGAESIRADAPTSAVRVSIRIRYRTDIKPAMRAVYMGKAYDIKAVLPDEVRREHVDLVCEVVQ